MKYQSEFRDPNAIRALCQRIRGITTRPWTLMEICGGQTHTIAKEGLGQILPEDIELVHGPGCPVCVTPIELVDAACEIALQPNVILCSYGDMMRVPGSQSDLYQSSAQGGDVRWVTSPLDAVGLARKWPEREVVFLAVGFETTAPASAMAVDLAERLGLRNFSILPGHVRVPPAMRLLLSDPECRIEGFLAAGHVCTVAGTMEYPSIADQFHVPIVVTGFEPVDILLGIEATIRQLESGKACVENLYRRSVTAEGNPLARATVEKVFEPCDLKWRGIGHVPQGGMRLRESFGEYDALSRFQISGGTHKDCQACRAAEVLQGKIKPTSCPAFGADCTPETPLGAPMVSSEGACAAYYQYRPDALA